MPPKANPQTQRRAAQAASQALAIRKNEPFSLYPLLPRAAGNEALCQEARIPAGKVFIPVNQCDTHELRECVVRSFLLSEDGKDHTIAFSEIPNLNRIIRLAEYIIPFWMPEVRCQMPEFIGKQCVIKRNIRHYVLKMVLYLKHN